jgi:hypothetical protein
VVRNRLLLLLLRTSLFLRTTNNQQQWLINQPLYCQNRLTLWSTLWTRALSRSPGSPVLLLAASASLTRVVIPNTLAPISGKHNLSGSPL